MATTYVFGESNSDLSIAGSDYNLVLMCKGVQDSATDNILKSGVAFTEIRIGYAMGNGEIQIVSFISEPGYPGTETWSTSGTETVSLYVNTGSGQIDCKVRLLRVNSSGTIQDTGSWTSTQTMSSNTRYTFNPTKPTWGTESNTDRLVLQTHCERVTAGGAPPNVYIGIAATGSTSGNESYYNSEVSGPDTSVYDTQYYLTNDSSDLSTYADGNYVMNTTGESSSSTITITVTQGTPKTIGWITPSGVPNNSDFTDGSENMHFVVEAVCDNYSSTILPTEELKLDFTAERLNSSGTVQESSTTYTAYLSIFDSDGETPQSISVGVPNKTWSSGATGDRLAVKCVLTGQYGTSQTADINFRVYNTSQVGSFYSAIVDNGGGTTTPKTLTPSATGTLSYDITAKLTKALTATGTLSKTLYAKLTKAITATGTNTITKMAQLARSFAATGTNTLSLARMYLQSISASAIGTNTLTKVFSRVLSLSYSATGSLSLTKMAQLTKTMTATGTASLTKVFSRVLSLTYSGVGTVSLSAVRFFERLLAIAATGTASLSKVPTYVLTLASSAVGTLSLTKMAQLTKTMAAVGTNTVTKLVKMTKTMAGTGTASAVNVFYFTLTLVASAVGTASMTKVFSRVLTLVYSAVGSLSITKLVKLTKTFSGIGSLTLSKTIKLTKAIAAVGTASLSLIFVGVKALNYVATGAVSLVTGAALTIGEIVIPFIQNITTSIVKEITDTLWSDND